MADKDCAGEHGGEHGGDHGDHAGSGEHGEFTEQDWTKMWREGFMDQTEEFMDPHKLFRNHAAELVDGRTNIKIFFPLCGNDVEMKVLYDGGHTIVGTEFVASAIESFFQKFGFEFTKTYNEKMKGDCYESKDGRIRLYRGDMFNFDKDIEGTFDGIADRGSLCSLINQQRPKYVELMISLMGDGCRYILNTNEYDISHNPGDEHSLPEYQIHDLYGKACNVKQLAFVDAMTDEMRKYGHANFYEKLHLITKK